MGGVLLWCPELREVYLESMGMGRVGAARLLFGSLERGILHALSRLQLEGSHIGDEGLEHLATALSRGALPVLEELWLSDNSIGDAGVRHLSPALSKFGPVTLTLLDLSQNNISDAGMARLASAVAMGDLKGTLPCLKHLFVEGNPAGAKSCNDAKEALGLKRVKRGAGEDEGEDQRRVNLYRAARPKYGYSTDFTLDGATANSAAAQAEAKQLRAELRGMTAPGNNLTGSLYSPG